ncbi:MAG: type V CRISPR-associated protein Cas12a/Cpf1 [Paludibacter sp.]|nr:type V CRISPR-associated protein Cas12a/Cpf1 [Paludibacter sp.]
MKKLTDFTGLYPLSKTLRFELIPQGRTLEYIQTNGLLEQDEHRAESYIIVKKIIDEYHKAFITNALEDFKLISLEDYYLYYQILKRNDDEKKKFEEIQSRLRKQLADRFTKQESFKNLFAKELIKEDLKTFVHTSEERELIEEFNSFTTYFTGFHENRKNMYSAEDKSTAISYRLIHQNLPKFIDNMRAFEKVQNSPVKDKFQTILSDNELGPIIQVLAVEDVFTLDYFNETLTQTGIDKYNHLIGGYTPEEGKVKVKGLNEYINLYNQTAKKENRIPKLKPLFKQILSDRSSVSFIPEEFADDTEVLESIEKFYQEIDNQVLNKIMEGERSLKELLQNLNDYDLAKIYIRNDVSLTDISQKIFGDWGIFQKALNRWYELNYKGKAKIGTEKYEDEQKKYFNNQDSYSIGYLNDCLLLMDNAYHKKVEEYFRIPVENAGEPDNLYLQLETNYSTINDLLNNPYSPDLKLAQDQPNVDKIKELLDSIKAIQWFIKPLLGKGNEAEKDERFYGEFTALWITLDQITPLYNKVRNYMTRKPYSTDKMKLNFENSTLLDGWDVNKESDNASIIFRKDGLYYLGIMNKKYNKIFKRDFEISSESCYEKMEYKLLPGANKMLPKVFFSNSRIGEFKPSVELMENYKNETHKKGDKFNINHCHDLINFFKSSINKHEDWKQFGFQFSDTGKYEDLSGFYREVEQQGYKITFKGIPETYIAQMVEEGKLYFFQLYNKDFSPNSKGTPNLHTLYWKMLFDGDNLKDVVYKLNGQAEVFFRKSSIKAENIIVHKAHEAINNKNELNDKRQSKFEYDIIKDKRYTVDKFQFHVPITMNFKARGINNINPEVNQFLKKTSDLHIIGLDRGERHLLYLTLIDSKGNIKQQFSLNEIVNEYEGKIYKTDYHKLLDNREGSRDDARKNWKTIETIKELKEGYLSQVIHKISELMVEYNAIVVLEDLNMGFMRGRQKVEKQVYQKFEKMLIDKLNYLVDKKTNASELGGTLHAYQFTNKFESFQKMGKQSGFLFYVPAWNTSKMDPVTGFVNLFDTRYENVDKAKTFFGKFDSIVYNSAKRYFEFSFDYTKFTTRADGTRTNWTLCTNATRIETFRNPIKNSQWDNRELVLTDELINLFEQYGIDYKHTGLKELIIRQTEKSFYERLLHLLKLTLQMRNSINGTDIDYLISPVVNEKGHFYDSRTATTILPQNADANGAYNIARKGMWIVEQIKQAEDLKKLKLAISNKEWLDFAQSMKSEEKWKNTLVFQP